MLVQKVLTSTYRFDQRLSVPATNLRGDSGYRLSLEGWRLRKTVMPFNGYYIYTVKPVHAKRMYARFGKC